MIDENKTPINKKSAVEFGGNLMNEVFFSFSFAFSQICIKFKMPVTVGYVSKSLNCDSRQDSRLPDPILFSPYSSNHLVLL